MILDFPYDDIPHGAFENPPGEITIQMVFSILLAYFFCKKAPESKKIPRVILRIPPMVELLLKCSFLYGILISSVKKPLNFQKSSG